MLKNDRALFYVFGVGQEKCGGNFVKKFIAQSVLNSKKLNKVK